MSYLFLRRWLFICFLEDNQEQHTVILRSLLEWKEIQMLDGTTTGYPGVITFATTDKLQSSCDTFNN